ncbi:MAG: NADH:ubiquinone reductase (Na(+)-transporting) subunit C [Saprospiraceae bacterium]
MHSTNYIVGFTLAMTTVVALTLSGLFFATKPLADKNEAVFNKRAILSAIKSQMMPDHNLDEMEDDAVLAFFDKFIEQTTLNMNGTPVDSIKAEKIEMSKESKKPEEDRLLPLYVYNSSKGEKFYIVSVYGKGLWDAIWGNIALASDYNTVAGASFDHKGETPGLGAEIKDNSMFPLSFKGKQIYTAEGDYTSVEVVKGGIKKGKEKFQVDGISGATITCDGVEEMLNRGIKYYEPYFAEAREASTKEIKK